MVCGGKSILKYEVTQVRCSKVSANLYKRAHMDIKRTKKSEILGRICLKSCIMVSLNLLACADSSTDTLYFILYTL